MSSESDRWKETPLWGNFWLALVFLWLTLLAIIIIEELTCNLHADCLIATWKLFGVFWGRRGKDRESRVLSPFSPPPPPLKCLRELARRLVFWWFEEGVFVFYCRILPSFHSNWSKVKTSVKHYLTDILQVQFNIAIVLGYKCYGYMYSVPLYTELSPFIYLYYRQLFWSLRYKIPSSKMWTYPIRIFCWL